MTQNVTKCDDKTTTIRPESDAKMTKSRLKTIAVVAGICLLGAGIAAGNVKQTDENPSNISPPSIHVVTPNQPEIPTYLTQEQHESGLVGVGKATQTVTETDDNPTGK